MLEAPPPLWRRRRAWLSLGTSLALLIWLGAQLDLEEAVALVQGASWPWLLLAAGLGPLQVLLSAERWRRAVTALGLPLPRSEAISEFALSTFLNQVLPGGMAGDAVRVLRQRRQDRPIGPVVRAAVADRALGLGVHCAVVIAGLLAWPWLHPGIPRPAGAVGLAVLIAGAMLSAAWVPEQTPIWGRQAAQMRTAVLSSQVVVGQLVLSVLLTCSFLLGFACCGVALGQPLGAATVTVVPWVLLAMVVPISVGGWGPREATAVALLPLVGVSMEAAAATSALYGLTALAGALPGALVPLLSRREP
ncbi:MAG TPA: flippase-like domain-containing protein [Deltaproteobacteria bacterium]|nr:flippase-like domain-containing protein [Deltaproteobacteria bacterium]